MTFMKKSPGDDGDTKNWVGNIYRGGQSSLAQQPQRAPLFSTVFARLSREKCQNCGFGRVDAAIRRNLPRFGPVRRGFAANQSDLMRTLRKCVTPLTLERVLACKLR